jgi:AraC-like DNA-binding protein
MLLQHKNGNMKANRLLAAILFLFAVSMVYYILYWTGYAQIYRWTNGWVTCIPFLYGPLVYMYILTLDKNRIPRRFWLHYLPFLLHMIFMIPILIRNVFGVIPFLRDTYFQPFRDTIDLINLIFIILQCLSQVLYAVFLIRYLKQDRQKMNTYCLPLEKSKHKWLVKTVVFYCIFVFSAISYYLLAWSGLLKIEYDYAISGVMSAFIYTVGVMGFRQPEIFHDRLIIQEDALADYTINASVLKPMLPLTAEKQTKYSRSTMQAHEAKRHHDNLLQYMEREKPYLDNSLKIQVLAEKLGLSTHHLSQVINTLMGQSYNDFINHYRVEEAKRLLSDQRNNAKILAIAFDAGFSNKATFHAVFKKHTGKSPSEYRVHALSKKSA